MQGCTLLTTEIFYVADSDQLTKHIDFDHCVVCFAVGANNMHRFGIHTKFSDALHQSRVATVGTSNADVLLTRRQDRKQRFREVFHNPCSLHEDHIPREHVGLDRVVNRFSDRFV